MDIFVPASLTRSPSPWLPHLRSYARSFSSFIQFDRLGYVGVSIKQKYATVFMSVGILHVKDRSRVARTSFKYSTVYKRTNGVNVWL